MSIIERYRKLDYKLPDKTLRWELSRGALDDLELVEDDVPQPKPDEVLFRVDTNAICFSDVKVLKNPTGHPRMAGYNLERDKIVPGHETSLTIIGAGEEAAKRFKPGERYLVQADIQKTGQAVGYNIWGGMLQFGVFGPVVQDYLIPLPQDIGYSQASLVEPWSCVVASYRRADLRPEDKYALLLGGAGPMGQMHLDRLISVKKAGQCPALEIIMVTDISHERLEVVRKRYEQRAADAGVKLVVVDVSNKTLDDAMKDEGIRKFQYIVALAPVEKVITDAMGKLDKYGVMNLFAGLSRGVGALNMGDIHYDQITVTGNSGSMIEDMKEVLRLACEGTLDTNYSAGAIAGMRAGKEAIQQVAAGQSENKIVVYNQIPDLPLLRVEETPGHIKFSDKARRGVEAGVWSVEAENEMLEQLLNLG